MSEEEKEAIETLKKIKKDKFITYYYSEKVIKVKDIVLNLIEKLQKENKELKQITQNYNAIGGETFGDDRIIVCSMEYFYNGYFKRNYIFKSKIREKIEKLELRKSFSDNIYEEFYSTQIDILKELLGEEE